MQSSIGFHAFGISWIRIILKTILDQMYINYNNYKGAYFGSVKYSNEQVRLITASQAFASNQNPLSRKYFVVSKFLRLNEDMKASSIQNLRKGISNRYLLQTVYSQFQIIEKILQDLLLLTVVFICPLRLFLKTFRSLRFLISPNCLTFILKLIQIQIELKRVPFSFKSLLNLKVYQNIQSNFKFTQSKSKILQQNFLLKSGFLNINNPQSEKLQININLLKFILNYKMLKFFGCCSNSSHHKAKPGEIALEVYNINGSKNKKSQQLINQPLPLFSSNDISLKKVIESDQNMKPIQEFKHDPSKLTQAGGGQFTFVKTILKSNYSEINDKLIQKKQKYTDPQFPPNNQSLGDDPKLQKTVQKWVRITDLYKDPVFFANGVDSKDVIQGYFYGAGNCYFMSAVSNLSKNPSRIKQIFGNTQISKQGIYYVKLFWKGVYKQIIVDDFIPVSSMGPVFARPPQGSNQVWVQILQKCYAKLFGSYKSMNGGLPSEAYYALTGAPSFFYSLSDSKQKVQKYWTLILESLQKGYCIDCGTPPNVIDGQKWLRPNHAYTMLGAYQIQNFRLIKLRNPQGSIEWSGRASDFDLQFWNQILPENKEKIGYQKKQDGVFFILWNDFFTYYSLFQICQYKDNAHLLSIRTLFTNKNANMFELQTAGGQVTLSLVQDSKRGTEVDLKYYKYSKSYFVICKLIQNNKKQKQYNIYRIAGKNNFGAHHQRLNLDPGTYIIYSKYQWVDNIDKQASFIAYSDSFIRIRQAKQSQYPQFLQKTFLAVANQAQQYTNPKQDFAFINKFYALSGGFGFYALKSSKQAKEKIIFEINEQQLNQKHLIIKKPYKNQKKIKVILKPGEEKIVLFRNKDAVIPQNLQIPDPKIIWQS